MSILAWAMRGGWRYIAGALAIAALLFALHSWGNKREAEGVAKERATWQPVVAAIKVRNAEIEAMRLASVSASAAVDNATERAVEARKATAGLQARLKAAGRAKGGCAVAPVNREGWSAAQ